MRMRPDETPEQHQQRITLTVETLERAAERINSGLCPHCGGKVERRDIRGRTAYAMPCGHRMGLTDSRKGRS